MVCPKCKTKNSSDTKFCVNCGQKLEIEKIKDEVNTMESTPKTNKLGLYTLRFLIMLVVIWVLKLILVALPFIKELVIPNFDISTVDLINILINLVVVVFLVAFTINLSTLWPRTVPDYPEVGDVISTFIYLIALILVYDSLKRLFESLIMESEPILILQIVFLLLAVGLVVRAGIIAYQALPGWLAKFRESIRAKSLED